PKSVLYACKYPERKDGTRYQGNFLLGTGSWAAKSNTWLLDPHLKSLSKKELTEYVRIRVGTWKPDERPKERDALNARTVADAKVAAATTERQEKTKGKENSARKAKSTTEAGVLNNTTAATPQSEPSKEMLSANDDLRQNSNTLFSNVNTTNSSETNNHSSQVKFFLLDREAQRAKMERWCQRKPTSQYHILNREGQKRYVEKHIDQLILRQTGSPKAHRPKKQSGTEALSSASPAQPGVVSALSSLADVMDVMSTLKTVVQSLKSTSNMQSTTAAAGAGLSYNPGPANHTSATLVAPEVAAVFKPSAGNIGKYLSAEPLPNATLAFIPSERALAPQLEHGENTTDVLRALAPFVPRYPSILKEPARVLRSEVQRDGPIVDGPNINTFATQILALGPTQFLTKVQTQIRTTLVPTANSYFTQPAGLNAPLQAAIGKQTVQSEQHAGAQHQTQISQQAYSTQQAAKENQTLQSEQYARA
ncbi:hypothetical protein V500_04962, partial [Pseudogymnoascus sp. VKM F-4518 (FW-2643)]